MLTWFSFIYGNIIKIISFQTVDNSVHFIVNSRDAVVGWLCTLTFFFILIRRQFKCCNTRSRSNMLTYLRTTSIFTVSLHQARQYFMVKEKKAIVYDQQKATKESKQQTVKSFVRLRMQKSKHGIKRKNDWKSFVKGIFSSSF